MKEFLYCDDISGNILKIFAKKKPSKEDIPYPLCGWILREWNNKTKKWDMPCFPLITWGRLKRMSFIGELKIKRRVYEKRN